MDPNKLIKKYHLYNGRKSFIALDELKTFCLSPGNIYIDKGQDKKDLKILNATDIVDDDFIKRFENKGIYFKLETTIQLKWVHHIKKTFQQFKDAYLPDEYLDKSEVLQIELARALWNYDSEISLADFAYACFQVFHQHHQPLTFDLYRLDIHLFRKALFVSALNVVFAYSCGYRDIKFLADMYRLGWMLDAGFIKYGYNYAIARACQHEKMNPGSGIEYLKKMNRPEIELKLFLNHPHYSYKMANANWKESFFYPELLRTILYHHEQSDGKGFPEGLNNSCISDWEAIVILSEYLVDYDEKEQVSLYTKNLKMIWSTLDNKKFENLPIYRVKIKIERMMHFWGQDAHNVRRGVSNE
jgi:hypothetical protein